MEGGEDQSVRGPGPLVAALLLGTAVVFGAAVRVQLALRDPGFDRRDPSGMLRSDPAELQYLGRRVAEAGGIPADFAADPRIAWPDRVDVPAAFTVGQEFLVAGLRGLLPGLPLHVAALLVGALTAALTVVGVHGLTRELTGSRRLALLGAATFAVLPGAYRTVGFVWMREDLSLPLMVAAAWGIARAARTRSVEAGGIAGALAGLAAGTWHGASVGLTVLLGAVLVTALAAPDGSGPSDGSAPGTRRALAAGLVAFALVALAVPALRAKGAALGLPASLALAALAGGAARSRADGGTRRRAVAGWAAALGAVVALAALRGALLGDDLGHVRALLVAKLAHLGRLPDDPTRLAPDVRLMWQGPFAGLGPLGVLRVLGVPAVAALVWALPAAARAFARRRVGREGATALALLALLALTLLVERGMAFAAPATAVGFALATRGLARAASAALARRIALMLLVVQVLLFAGWAQRFELGWNRPLAALEERRAAVAAVRERVPPGEAVLTGFLLGPALLADHQRPIVLQPKWETRAARERVHRFLAAVYREDLAGFIAYARDEARCEWVLVDESEWFRLGAMRFAAGFPRDLAAPPSGSALEALLAPDVPPGLEEVWSDGRGRRLLWLR